jgi:lipoprotein-anchoring transpeptidase ErfK/SrfK
VIVAVLVVSGGAFGLTRIGGETALPATTTTSAAPTTTTTAAPTTTSTEAPTTTEPTGPRPDDAVLERGEQGEEVAALQRRLAELRFDPGPADGVFGGGTLYAVQGFQKLAGLAPDGKVGPEVQAALAAPPVPAVMVPDGGPNRVEIDKQRQLLFLYVDGSLRLITHVSTGNDETYCVEGSCNNRAVTPEGSFRFLWRYKGWRESRLGKLYNPGYFTRSGVAIHGSTSVPTYPASHGCVRIPMHIAEYFPSLVKSGDPVYVLANASSPVGEPPPPTTPPGPPPEDPPTSPDTEPPPESTTTTEPPPESTTTTTEPPPESTTTTTDTTVTVP